MIIIMIIIIIIIISIIFIIICIINYYEISVTRKKKRIANKRITGILNE